MFGLAVAEDNAAASQVIWRKFHHYPVLGQNPDVVLPHFAGNVSENFVTVGEFYPKHCVRESFHDRALDLDDTVLFGHILHNPELTCTPGWDAWDGLDTSLPIGCWSTPIPVFPGRSIRKGVF